MKKAEMPLNTKPIKPEIIALKILFYFSDLHKIFGNIKSTSFFNM